MDRRAFLSIVASSPLVFGLHEWLAQEPPPEKLVPEWYRAALKRMKETNRYGIVIVVPDDAKERERIGKALIDRYNEFNSENHEPFGAAVFICMTTSLAERLIDLDWKKGAFKPNKILLAPDGRVDSWFKVESETLESAERFSFSFANTAYGFPKGEKLERQASAIEKNLPDAVQKVASQLEGETYDPEAGAKLMEKADSILPWIVHRSHKVAEARPEQKGSGLRTFLTHYWIGQSMIANDPCLPFGVKVEALPAEDPCPPCGMARISLGKARKFLSFFEK